jgi:23S rRNA (uracil1939-C5)-methyltransferase
LLLTIEKLVYGGDGLARTPPASDGRSLAVFVPFVLPGEKIEAELSPAKPGFARAAVAQLVTPSPNRVAGRCPYFERCGGCHYQHIPYERQLDFKAQIVRETLQRVARLDLASEIRLHPSPPWNYRNRTRLHVRTAPEFALGYYRFASRDFLPIRECPISSPLINQAISLLTELSGLSCPPEVEELEFFADAADAQLIAWAFCQREARPPTLIRWAESLRREFPIMAGLHFFAASRSPEGSPAAKPIASSGAQSLLYQTSHGSYQVSAGAFFQVNRHLIEELVSVVTSGVTGSLAFDLYAGGGLFSLPLARVFRHIFAVESSQTSFADLRHNVPASVKAVSARTGDYLKSGYSKSRGRSESPDLVVLDPPRTGAGTTVIRHLADLGPQRVRYVSCDPATLARDLAPLVSSGYRIEEAHLFDLFPQTYHIESVMLLAR